MASRKLSAWISVPLGLAAFGFCFLLERKRPLRRRVEPEVPHEARNLAIAAAAAATVRLLESPVVEPLAALVERRGWGLLGRLRLPRWLEVALGVVLLDYTLYIWHVLTHRVPALWRFHAVHHIDLDLTTTTATRFHFGELALSVPYRAAQVVAIGADPFTLSVWQTVLFVSILFHHSDVRIPHGAERLLSRFVVTPRMHGIHHSIVIDEMDSNWSSGLSIWDRLHGTFRMDVPQDEITIGVARYLDPYDTGLVDMLALPFASAAPRSEERSQNALATRK